MLAGEYLGGATFRELARKYSVSDVAIRNAVLRTGTRTRSSRETRSSVLASGDPELQAEVLALYRDGSSVRELTRKYKCNSRLISKLLCDSGAVLHSGGRHHPMFRTDEECLHVALAYEAGASLGSLCTKYSCTPPAIKRAVQRGGGQLRPGGRPKFWTDERLKYISEQYISGRSQQSIANELGVHQTAVSNRLRALGVLPVKPRASGDQHGSWRGGLSFDGSGYISILVTLDDLPYCTPNCNGRVLEHRLVMARALGRPLTRDETVHHVNGDRTDNRIENLQLRQGRHGKGVVMVCQSCGSHDVKAVEIAT